MDKKRGGAQLEAGTSGRIESASVILIHVRRGKSKGREGNQLHSPGGSKERGEPKWLD